MAYKTIVTYLNSSTSTEPMTALACSIAQSQQAHLIGLAPTGLATAGVDMMHGASAVILAEQQAQLEAAANQAVAEFDNQCKAAGLDARESLVVPDSATNTLTIHSRYCDLIIAQQPDVNTARTGDRAIIENIILSAGKPVLMVPWCGAEPKAPEHALIAWDGSREGARAINDALPLLTNTRKVTVLTINPKKAPVGYHGSLPIADLTVYLSRHGINATTKSITSEIDTGNSILSYCADCGADFCIMGAYGHSRFRELILGGATRTVLDSMTVPVLMSH